MTTQTPKNTIVASHNRFVLAIVISLIVGLASGAFVLSFDALHALALASAIDAQLAWIWPLIIDGFIVTATIAIFSLRGRGQTWYPWASLMLFAFVSVFGNSIHAVNNQDILGVNVWIASSVSAAPAIALLLASHFLVIMISAPKSVRVDEVEVHSSQHPEKIIGTAILNDVFEEPRITVSTVAVDVVDVPQEKKTPVPVLEQAAPIVNTPTPAEKVTSVTEPVMVAPVVVERAEQEAVVVETSQPAESKKAIISDNEIIAWIKKNGKDDVNATKMGEAFGLTSRTMHRRLRKIKDQYGEELENL